MEGPSLNGLININDIEMKEKMGNVNKKKCQEIKLYIQGLDGLNYETEWYIIFQKGILLFFWIKRKKKKEYYWSHSYLKRRN